jgi:TetR/AcrR family transcriptional regulator, transcriptional repressor for nem operon
MGSWSHEKKDLEKYTVRYIFAAVTKSERTRNHIIETTAPLFNMRGYEGTSLEDLCKATGLTKGALYGNFQNKVELFTEAFQYAIRRMRAEGRARVDNETTNKGKLLALMEFFSTYVLDPPVRGGCPLLNNAVDADDNRPQLKKAVARELERSVNYIASLLTAGKEHGEFRKKFDARQTATLFFCAIEGAIMFSRVSASDEAMKIVTGMIRRMVAELE